MSIYPPTQPQPEPAKPDVPDLQEIAAQVAPAAIGHVLKTRDMLNRSIARTLNNGMFTAGLTTHFMDPQIWAELLQLQSAVVQRLKQQNEAWLKGCAILMQDYVQIKDANTMSKLVEKQYNLVAQWQQLIGSQATNLMGLEENIEVDYGYWASQKLNV